jgi:hypothetical protein
MAVTTEKSQTWALSRRSASGAQLTIQPHEIHRFQPIPPGIRVLCGLAWITWNGKDILLAQGQTIQFESGKDDPVISPIGREAVVVEMLQRPSSRSL